MKYDLAIIGGGPAGYTAGERAGENGMQTVLFEKKAVGGVCLNEGCIPTKTLLYSAKILDTIKKAVPYGILPEGAPTFDLPKIISRKDKIVRRLVEGVRMRLTSSGVSIIDGEATITGQENNLIRITCNNQTYLAKYVLLCTGSETIIPPIPGLDKANFWTSREALDLTELPKTLTIIGGGVIGMEFASFFNSLGVKVKVVEMMPEILGAMDKESGSMLRTLYKKKGIEFYLNTKVTGIKENQVLAEKDGQAVTIDTDKILVSIGRRAITRNLGLEKLNIELHKNGVKVNEYMQTSHPQVYACGDITGYSLLAHTAYREATVAVYHILGKDEPMNYKAIPSVVYTNPEVSGIGLTEEELKSMNAPYSVLKIPMTYSGRFVAENEQGNGLCKLLLDTDRRIIGCHLVGNPSSEFIITAGIAIEKGYTVEECRKFIFPHPTVSEIIHECLYS